MSWCWTGLISSNFYKITLWYFYYTCKDRYLLCFSFHQISSRREKIVNNSASTCLEWMLFKMWYQQWLVHISPHCVSARAWNVISYWDISQTLTIFIRPVFSPRWRVVPSNLSTRSYGKFCLVKWSALQLLYTDLIDGQSGNNSF